jgi:hypothetical protein
VEFGTSYGVSTPYLALAVRENGGGVVADNVGAFWADTGDSLSRVRNPANGVSSALLGLKEGTEASVRLAAKPA